MIGRTLKDKIKDQRLKIKKRFKGAEAQRQNAVSRRQREARQKTNEMNPDKIVIFRISDRD